MAIENRNQPRPTTIVSAAPKHHAPTPFPQPPPLAMFSITAPVKNQEDEAQTRQIEAGYDPMRNAVDAPPPPPPRNPIFIQNELIDDGLLFFDVMGQPDTPAENAITREKLTTKRDYERAKVVQIDKFDEEHAKDDPNKDDLREIDKNVRFIEFKQAGGYLNTNPTPEEEEARQTYVGELAELIRKHTNMKNYKDLAEQGYDVTPFLGEDSGIGIKGSGSNLARSDLEARLYVSENMDGSKAEIDAKIENLLSLYPDLYVNYGDFHKEIKDASEDAFDKMWSQLYWSNDTKELLFDHTPSKAERMAVDFDAGLNKISHSRNYQHYATHAITAFHGGSNIFTKAISAFGSFPQTMVEETMQFKDFQDELKARDINDDEILGSKALTNAVTDPFGFAQSEMREASGFDKAADAASQLGNALEGAGLKHANKIGDSVGKSATELGFQKQDEFLNKDVDIGAGISNTLQAMLDEGKSAGMRGKSLSTARPKPTIVGNKPLEANMEISHDTSTLAYQPNETRSKFAPEGYTYMQGMSTKYRGVWINEKTNQVQVSYRGTNPTHLPDLRADFHIMAGTQVFNTRFQNEVAYFRDNFANNPKYSIEITGHSLGGAIASHINEVFKQSDNIKHVYTYNMGHGRFGDTMGGSHDPAANYFQRQTNVLQSGDPVGMTLDGETVPTIGNSFVYNNLGADRGMLARHKLDNFTNPNWVGNKISDKGAPSTITGKLSKGFDDGVLNTAFTAARTVAKVNKTIKTMKKTPGYGTKTNLRHGGTLHDKIRDLEYQSHDYNYNPSMNYSNSHHRNNSVFNEISGGGVFNQQYSGFNNNNNNTNPVFGNDRNTHREQNERCPIGYIFDSQANRCVKANRR